MNPPNSQGPSSNKSKAGKKKNGTKNVEVSPEIAQRLKHLSRILPR